MSLSSKSQSSVFLYAFAMPLPFNSKSRTFSCESCCRRNDRSGSIRLSLWMRRSFPTSGRWPIAPNPGGKPCQCNKTRPNGAEPSLEHQTIFGMGIVENTRCSPRIPCEQRCGMPLKDRLLRAMSVFLIAGLYLSTRSHCCQEIQACWDSTRV